MTRRNDSTAQVALAFLGAPAPPPAPLRPAPPANDAVLPVAPPTPDVEPIAITVADSQPEWVVYIAPLGITVENMDDGPPPALVRSTNRWTAEMAVATAVGLSDDRCFAMPSRPSLREGAVLLEVHPLRKAPAPFNLGDAIGTALGSMNERAEADLQRLRQLHADILGCTVDELDAKMAADHAEQNREKLARKADGAARRQPAPKNAPAPRVKGKAASVADGMRAITPRQQELLALVEVDQRTNRVVYTREEHLPDWSALKQAVEALGGRWLGKSKHSKGGWAFAEDVDAMDVIQCALATGAIFDSRLLGFFPTSADLADAMVARLNLVPGDRVLEPSAGKGAIALAVRRACPDAEVVCCELVPEHCAELRALGFTVIEGDFLALGAAEIGRVTVVAANPPFGKGRVELHHLRRMLDLLEPGGRLGAIMPGSLRYRDDAIGAAMRVDLERHGALITDNPAGAFKDAGTMIHTVTLTLTKGA